MINFKGLVKTRASSLSNPEGKLSSPDAFFRLRFRSSLRISGSFAVSKVNWLPVTWLGRFSSALQVCSRQRFLATVLKYSQKLFAMKLLSVDFDPFITNAKPCSEGNLVGKNFSMAAQNLSVESAQSLRRSRLYVLLHFLTRSFTLSVVLPFYKKTNRFPD